MIDIREHDRKMVETIKARSVRAPERDYLDVTCWRDGCVEHYLRGDALVYSLPYVPIGPYAQ